MINPPSSRQRAGLKKSIPHALRACRHRCCVKRFEPVHEGGRVQRVQRGAVAGGWVDHGAASLPWWSITMGVLGTRHGKAGQKWE